MPGERRGVYGGIGAEERRLARRARLLDAALELIGREGWRAATVRAICSGSRLTPRYFYESFAGRDELLLALFDEIAQQGADAVLEAVGEAPDDAPAKARAAIGAFVELVTDDPRKARVLFVEATGSASLTRRRFQAMRMFAQLVGSQAREFYRMPDAVDPLIEESALMLAGGFTEVLLAWLDGRLHVTREELIDDCAELFVVGGEGVARLVAARAERGS